MSKLAVIYGSYAYQGDLVRYAGNRAISRSQLVSGRSVFGTIWGGIKGAVLGGLTGGLPGAITGGIGGLTGGGGRPPSARPPVPRGGGTPPLVPGNQPGGVFAPGSPGGIIPMPGEVFGVGPGRPMVPGAMRRRRARGITAVELRGFRKVAGLLRREGMRPRQLGGGSRRRRRC